jgi:hypothetical protein
MQEILTELEPCLGQAESVRDEDVAPAILRIRLRMRDLAIEQARAGLELHEHDVFYKEAQACGADPAVLAELEIGRSRARARESAADAEILILNEAVDLLPQHFPELAFSGEDVEREIAQPFLMRYLRVYNYFQPDTWLAEYI